MVLFLGIIFKQAELAVSSWEFVVRRWWMVVRGSWLGTRGGVGGCGRWRAYISGMGQDDKWDLPYLFPRLCCLDTGKWYRIEGHIHYFRELTEERGDERETTRVPSYVYFRIYDDNGILVKDTNDWYLGEYTLQEWYDMDRYFWLEGVANSWYMGNNGPYSAQGAGPNWCADYAAIEIRDDTWPGPVGGEPQPPAQASNPSPANSSTDVSVGEAWGFGRWWVALESLSGGWDG